MSTEVSINLLTLNCWGIPLISKNRKERMVAIAEKFNTEDYDVICLQEVWSVNDFRMIKAKTREKLPHSHYFYSGVFGSGICVLSRYAIQEVMFHKWPLNGYVHKINHGDWFGGKGVGLCRIKICDMNVNIYTAHLHAEYDTKYDEYTAHRVLQAFDTAQFIRMTSGGADAVILAGDLNTGPQDLAYRIICGVAGLRDACPNSLTNLGTNDCANNSYTNSKLARICPEGKRIDHILYLGSKNCKIEVSNFQHPFPKRVPTRNFSYSDHEAVLTNFKFNMGETESVNLDVRDTLKEAVDICESSLKCVRGHRFWYLLWGCILTVPLVWSMGLDGTTSVKMCVGLNIGRIFLTATLCYTLFMSTIWNSAEKNALKAGCSGMEIYLTRLNNDSYEK